MFLDLVCLAVVAWVSFRVAEEGAWGAVVVFFSVLFAGLFAMNLFEPLAEWLAIRFFRDEIWQSRGDVISLLGLFGGAVFALRVATERLAPARMPIPQPMEISVRWLAGVATGYLTLAVLLTSLHVAPLPRVVTQTEVLEFGGFRADAPEFFRTRARSAMAAIQSVDVAACAQSRQLSSAVRWPAVSFGQ